VWVALPLRSRPFDLVEDLDIRESTTWCCPPSAFASHSNLTATHVVVGCPPSVFASFRPCGGPELDVRLPTALPSAFASYRRRAGSLRRCWAFGTVLVIRTQRCSRVLPSRRSLPLRCAGMVVVGTRTQQWAGFCPRAVPSLLGSGRRCRCRAYPTVGWVLLFRSSYPPLGWRGRRPNPTQWWVGFRVDGWQLRMFGPCVVR